MTPKKVREIFKRFQEQNPEPKTELNYKTPYELLVAVILSAQATDISVNKATKELFKAANTPEKILKLKEDGLKKYIKTIGLFNSKAKSITNMSQMLVDEYESQVPDTREALEKLPGVGRKTANVILNALYGAPTIAVDTHVLRLGNRIGLAPGKTPTEVEKKLEKVIPEEYKNNASHWLVLHGRYICKAKKPLCKECIISDLCEYKEKNL